MAATRGVPVHHLRQRWVCRGLPIVPPPKLPPDVSAALGGVVVSGRVMQAPSGVPLLVGTLGCPTSDTPGTFCSHTHAQPPTPLPWAPQEQDRGGSNGETQGGAL